MFTATVTAVGAINAESVYQITDNVSGGIDLLNMPGYYADRLKGPSSSSKSVSGEVTHSVATDENPFLLIGTGGNRMVTFAADTKLLGVPIKLVSDDGVSTWSKWQFTGLRSLSPATNIVADTLSTLEVENNYTLSIVGDYGRSIEYNYLLKGQIFGYIDMYVGRNAGNASLVVDGGTIYITGSKDIFLGRCDTPVRKDIVAKAFMTNATVTCRDIYLMYGCKGANVGSLGNESVLVDIGKETVISLRQFFMRAGNFSRIRYAGGRTVFSNADSELFKATGYDAEGGYPNPVITVEAADGNPIDVEVPSDRNLCGGYDGRKIHITGNGGFTKRGNGILTWNQMPSSVNSVCDYTGPTQIKGGGIKLTSAAYAPGRGVLTVESGAFLDMNGSGTVFVGASGAGEIRNTSETAATLTLGYGGGNDDFDIAVSNSVSIAKTGTGTLTLKERACGYAGDLTISDGTFKVSPGVVATNLCVVTVEKGATLDLRGATFRCRSLVKRGTLLVDGDTVIVVGCDEDATYGGFALPGGIVKEGTGAFTIYANGAADSDATVKVGRLVCRPLTYSGKYFKVNVFHTVETNNIYHLYVAEFSLFDADGNRVNAHEWEYHSRPGEGAYGTYGGVPNASGLAEWEVALWSGNGYQYYNYADNYGPDKAMDGDSATVYDQQYWWSGNAFMFRLPDSTADVAGYQFTTPTFAHDSLPAQWKIYGSEDGIDWVLLADNSVDWDDDVARTAAIDAVPHTRGAEYNNGVPFTFDAYAGGAIAPFGTGVVSVAEGATLDMSSSLMQIARLSVSSSVPSGSIMRFTPAVNGELILDSLPAGLNDTNVPLPITVGEVASPENLKSWRVSVNGQVAEGVGVRFRNGGLVLSKTQGFMLIVR